jgi:hypothetical protein
MIMKALIIIRCKGNIPSNNFVVCVESITWLRRETI